MGNERQITDDPELCVCGAALVEAEIENGRMLPHIFACYEKAGLEVGWFRQDKWRRLWQAIAEEWKDKKALDALLVAKRVAGTDGARSVEEAISGTPTSAHAEYYVSIMRDRQVGVELNRMCRATMSELDETNANAKLEELAKKAMALQSKLSAAGDDIIDLKAAADRAVAEAELIREERIVKGNKSFFIGLPLPWQIANYYYTGLKPGLHVIAASPSVGKTAMAVNISNFWNRMGIKHVFFSIDMTADQAVRRYPCISQQVSLAKINWGANHEEIELYKKGFEELKKLDNLDISEAYGIEKIRNILYREVYSRGAQAACIDYVQLVQDNERGNPPFYEQVRHVVTTMKNLANHDLKIPIVILVQLSREYAKDQRKQARRPGIEDLGDSAEIGRAAATVAVLDRDADVAAYWKKNPPYALAGGKGPEVGYLAKQLRPVWFYLIKNQQGQTGDIPFVMYPRYFMMRPGDYEAEPEFMDGGDGKGKPICVKNFSLIRDDWLHLEFDKLLVETGALIEEKRGMTMEKREAPVNGKLAI